MVFGSKTQLVRIGAKAPDFRLKDQGGQEISLSNYHGKSHVVLFFYPKDNTPVCTKEACLFRDHYQELRETEAELLGISGDSEQSHQGFAEQNNLNFPLLSDIENQVRKDYGIPKRFGLMPGRVTLVIAKDGTVAHICDAPFDAEAHVKESLQALRKLG